MGATLPDTFAMTPATRAFSIGRFLDSSGRLGRVFDNEVAQNKKFFELLLRDRTDYFSIAFQDDASLERIADQFFLTRFFQGLADHAAQS